MFKTRRARSAASPSKAEGTRAHLLATSLKLFRKNGFEATTMRDIADGAGMSLGAAYYHFTCKEELVLAYYEEIQNAHEARLERELPGCTSLEERLSLLFQIKLDLISRDRQLLGTLFRFAGEPEHALSPFASASNGIRIRSLALVARAIGDTTLPCELEGLATQAIWFAHLGLILRAVYDSDKNLRATRALAETVASSVAKLVPLVRLPGAIALLANFAKHLPEVPS